MANREAILEIMADIDANVDVSELLSGTETRITEKLKLEDQITGSLPSIKDTDKVIQLNLARFIAAITEATAAVTYLKDAGVSEEIIDRIAESTRVEVSDRIEKSIEKSKNPGTVLDRMREQGLIL